MEIKKVFSYRKKVSRILCYSLVGFIFFIIAIALLYKATKRTFYFYNHRYDVVLTDSMSVKNEKYKDFLQGTKQIKAFDFVVSERITNKTKLKVLDVVIFDNPDIGMDMHRIVDIDRIGDTVKFENIGEEKVGDVDVLKFTSPSSSIVLKDEFCYTDVEVVNYSQEAFDENEYYFNVGPTFITPNITSTLESNGYYKNIITYHKDSSAPATFSITKKSYDFKSSFASIKLHGAKKEILINNSTFKQAEDGEFMFNITEKFLIRGDKANTDDGWYEKSKLQSKVIMVLPKLGYPIRFLASPYGTILLVGLMFIPLTYWFIFDKKKEEREAIEKNEEE